MKVSDILASSRQAYPSLEIVPPLTGITKTELIDGIRPFMEFSPRYINITCHRDEYEFRRQEDGSYTRRLVRKRVSESAVCGAIQSELKVEVVPHLICGGATAEQIEFQLQDFKFMDISNVLALRGDCVSGEKRFTPEPGGYTHANELVAAIRGFEDERDCKGFFSIGVGAYPEKHFECANIEDDIANLKRKVDAGADYIITQMFFDNEDFYRFRDRCSRAHNKVPIVCGIMPFTSVQQIQRMAFTCGASIPAAVIKRLVAAGDDKQAQQDAGVAYACEQLVDLARNGVDGLHVYTMNRPSVANATHDRLLQAGYVEA